MIRIQQDKLGIAAYDEAEGLLLVGEATRNAARRVWTVRVGDTVRYRHRRRSAV